jgi:citrate synthase
MGLVTTLRSDMAWSTPRHVFVRGRDLDGLIGTIDLGEMLFLVLTGRLPTSSEARITNAALVALVEHGMTPSAIAARLTWLGAPENLQGAVASGLLGVGSRFVGSVDEVARMLQEAMVGLQHDDGTDTPADDVTFYAQAAETLVADFHERRVPIPGIGHPVHRPEDPRAVSLIALVDELGSRGPHLCLQEAICAAAGKRWGRHLPINVTGAIGAVVSDLGFPWQIARGFPVISRCVGLVGHLREELGHPIARSLARDTEVRITRISDAAAQDGLADDGAA